MDCCKKENIKEEKKKGIVRGVLYGLLPHTFCIAFILFSVIGATTAITLLKPLLLNRYFFYILISISFVFATISAVVYLKRNRNLSIVGAKRSWKYLTLLYGITIFINVILFLVVFPLAANLNLNKSEESLAVNAQNVQLSSLTLEVSIPCSGHATLITGELKKISGVKEIKFRLPNLFDIKYDPLQTSQEEILSLEVFKTYQAKII